MAEENTPCVCVCVNNLKPLRVFIVYQVCPQIQLTHTHTHKILKSLGKTCLRTPIDEHHIASSKYTFHAGMFVLSGRVVPCESRSTRTHTHTEAWLRHCRGLGHRTFTTPPRTELLCVSVPSSSRKSERLFTNTHRTLRWKIPHVFVAIPVYMHTQFYQPYIYTLDVCEHVLEHSRLKIHAHYEWLTNIYTNVEVARYETARIKRASSMDVARALHC